MGAVVDLRALQIYTGSAGDATHLMHTIMEQSMIQDKQTAYATHSLTTNYDDFYHISRAAVPYNTYRFLDTDRTTSMDKYYPNAEARRLQPDVLIMNLHRSSPTSGSKIQSSCELDQVVRYMEWDYGLRVVLAHHGDDPNWGHWTTAHYASGSRVWACSDPTADHRTPFPHRAQTTGQK